MEAECATACSDLCLQSRMESNDEPIAVDITEVKPEDHGAAWTGSSTFDIENQGQKTGLSLPEQDDICH